MSRHHDLAGLLRAHTPADDLEAEHRAAMLALAEAGEAAFSRGHFDPGHFTASAFVLDPTHTRVLLILHGKLHRWLQPGGHVDPEDADIVQAALREVREETGLSEVRTLGGLLDLDVHVIPERKADPAHKHFDVRVLLEAQSLEAEAGSDAQAAKWVPLDEVSSIESDESVQRAVRKIKARLGREGEA